MLVSFAWLIIELYGVYSIPGKLHVDQFGGVAARLTQQSHQNVGQVSITIW